MLWLDTKEIAKIAPGMKKQTHKLKKARTLIVDDHPVVRQGLAQLINQEPDLGLCVEAADTEEALRAVGQHNIDMAIIDISLRGKITGIELIKHIKARNPALPVLIFSMHDELPYVELALKAGAAGYIVKQEASKSVILAIRRVLSGKIYLSDKVAAKFLHTSDNGQIRPNNFGLDSLTKRELEVFRLTGQGHKARQISQELVLSTKTVESHIAHIKEKLNLLDITELVQYAVQWTHAVGKT